MIRNEYNPAEVSPPGATLLEMIEERGMSQAELAQRTGRPLKTINEIIKGKAAVTAETAIQLERVLGAPASFWNNRESHYREALARARQRAELAGQTKWLKEVPIRQMEKLGWIPTEKDKVRQVERVLEFFGVASVEALQERGEQPRFRQSTAFQSNPLAVGAWLRQGHLEAEKIDCAPFDEKKFRAALLKAKAMTQAKPADSIDQLKSICSAAGVALVVVRELPGTHLSGAARWLSPNKALIELSARQKTHHHFWFTFFHEASHILNHRTKSIFIDAAYVGAGREEEYASVLFGARQQSQR